MNNGDFNNREPSPENEGMPFRRRERNPLLPLCVLFFGIFGIVNPPFAIAALVLGLADRHTSNPWDKKSRIGTVLGAIILGVFVFAVVLSVLITVFTPNLGSELAAGLKGLAAYSSSAIRNPFLY